MLSLVQPVYADYKGTQKLTGGTAPNNLYVFNTLSVFTGDTESIYASYDSGETFDTNTIFTVISGTENIQVDKSVDTNNQASVKGLKAGTSVIRVTSAANTKLKEDVTVTVKDEEAYSSLSFSSESTTFKINNSEFPSYQSISYTANPENVNPQRLTAVSSDPSVFDAAGLGKDTLSIKLYKEGTATLTLTAENGVSASIIVTIQAGNYATGFKDDIPHEITIKPNEKFNLDKFVRNYVEPENASSTENIKYAVNSSYCSAEISDGILDDKKQETFSVSATLENGVCTFIQVYVHDDVTAFDFDIKEYSIASDVKYLSLLNHLKTNLSSASLIDPNKITWTSSKENIAKIKNTNGLLEILSTGDTTITAKYRDFSASMVLHVINRKAPTSMSVLGTYKPLELYVGQVYNLYVNYDGSYELTDRHTDYTLSKGNDIVSIDSKSDSNSVNITANKVGEAELKVTSRANKELSKTVKITVKEAEQATAIKFRKSEITTTIRNGKVPNNVSYLDYSLEPYAASYTTSLKYSFDGPNDLLDQVKVQNGFVYYRPIKAGTTNLVLTADNGISSSVKITVLDGDYATGFVDQSSIQKKLKVGETLDFGANIRSGLAPADEKCSDEKITYSISNNGVGSVDENGIVTALKEGTSTVTASLMNGQTKSATIYVLNDVIDLEFTKEETSIALDELYPNVDSLLRLNKSLNAYNIPRDELKWSSSNDDVASFVTQNGYTSFRLNGIGDTTISATYEGHTASMILHVVDRKMPTAFDCADQLILDVGSCKGLSSVYEDNDIVYSDTAYEVISGSDTINVTQESKDNIVVEGIKAGEAEIRLTSKYNKNLSKVVKVTVESWDTQTTKIRLIDKTGKNILENSSADVIFGAKYDLEYSSKTSGKQIPNIFENMQNSTYLQTLGGGGVQELDYAYAIEYFVPSKLGAETIKIDDDHSITLNIVSEPIKVKDVVYNNVADIDTNLVNQCVRTMSDNISNVSTLSEKNTAVSSILASNPLQSNTVVDAKGNETQELVEADTNFFTGTTVQLKDTTLQYDITPTVSIHQKDSKIELGSTELNVTENINMALPVGNLVDSSVTQVYVVHEKKDGTKIVKIGIVNNGIVTFENSDGFSTFEILLNTEVNDENTKQLMNTADTGDATNTLFYAGIMLISSFSALAIVLFKKKYLQN
jgi:uncharacterized protein YjdB